MERDVSSDVAPTIQERHAHSVAQEASVQGAVRKRRIGGLESPQDPAPDPRPNESPGRRRQRARVDLLEVPQAVREAVLDSPLSRRLADTVPVQRAARQEPAEILDPVKRGILKVMRQMDREMEKQVIVA